MRRMKSTSLFLIAGLFALLLTVNLVHTPTANAKTVKPIPLDKALLAAAKKGVDGIVNKTVVNAKSVPKGQPVPKDIRYFNGKRFVYPEAKFARFESGAITGVSLVASISKEAKYRNVAIKSMDEFIKTWQAANGSFEKNDISTMFVAANIGLSLDAMWKDLPKAKRTAWTKSITKSADFLEKNGNYKWYTNGNISLGNAVVAGMAWKFSGSAKYKGYYDKALNFVINPGKERWAGRGLIITKADSSATGAKGAGYLTETGPGGTGYDPEYTQLQADLASVSYMIVRDPKMLRLANLLTNQLMKRVNTTDWVLNASNGTRHTQSAYYIPFVSSSLSILSTIGGRSDLTRYVGSQATETSKIFKTMGDHATSYWYMGFGHSFGPALRVLSKR